MEETFTIKNYENYTFRIKKMNAIETLALQTQYKFNSVDQSMAVFNQILEFIEVDCANQWVPVKMKGRNVYTPAEVETEVILVRGLISEFTKRFMEPVFQKSAESK